MPGELKTGEGQGPGTDEAKVAAQKVADEKVATDKATADKATADKAAADKVVSDKAAADKAAADKEADRKASSELPDWAMTERKSLRDEAASWRVKYRESETARTEAEAKVQTDLADAEHKKLRDDVAAEAGLPTSFGKRLEGATKEELEKDAVEMARSFGGGRSRKLRGGLSPDDSTESSEDIRARARRVRGRR